MTKTGAHHDGLGASRACARRRFSASAASDTVVLMFPVDQGEWIDYGRTNRRVASTRVDETGTFSLPAPPDGEYFVIAIPDAESDDWQNPATLAKLATMADRFLMQGDGPTALSLRLQRNQ